MALTCKFLSVDGVNSVFNEDGSKSLAYQDLLEYFDGDQSEALDTYLTVFSEDYVQQTGLKPEESTAQDILKFLSNESISNENLSLIEINSIKSIMRSYGFVSLKELSNKLNDIFKPNGIFDFSIKRMVKSGLYTQEEAESLDPDIILDVVNKITSTSINRDITIENDFSSKDVLIKNTNSEKTIIGTYQNISLNDIYTYVLSNVDVVNESTVSEALSNSPYSFINDKLEESIDFKNSFFNDISNKKTVKRVYVSDGKVVSVDNFEKESLKNTLLAGVKAFDIEADFNFLDNISQEVWDRKPETVSKVIRETERKLIKYNVDLIGLSEASMYDREGVLIAIESALNMIKNPSVENIDIFTNTKNLLMPMSNNHAIIDSNDKLEGLNIVYLETEMSKNELLDKYNLIKVGDNLYHAISLDTNEMYESLYEGLVSGEFSIPSVLITVDNVDDILNKEDVIKDISNYVNSRNTGYEIGLNEKASLAQIAFDYELFKENNPPSEVIENQEYLTTDFVSDFNQYILEEKLKGSEVYNNVLKHFYVSDTDLNLNSFSLPDISGIKYEKELRDYASLKREGQIKELSSRDNTSISVDLQAINNPNSIQEIDGNKDVVIDNDYIVSKTSGELYKRIGNNVYRKVYSDLRGDVYQRVNIINDGTYFDTNDNFKTNIEKAKSILNKININNIVDINTSELESKTKFNKKVPVNNKLIDKAIKSLNTIISGTKNSVRSVISRFIKNEEQLNAVINLLDNINNVASKRLGISVDEYIKRHKTSYSKDSLTNKEALQLFNIAFSENHNDLSGDLLTLNQANNDLSNSFDKSPLPIKLGLDKNNVEHQWLFKYLTTTTDGKKLLGEAGKNPAYESVVNLMKERFDEIEEQVMYGTDYFITDIKDSFIDSQIEKAINGGNSENEYLWENVKSDKQKYIKEQQDLQRNNLKGLVDYYRESIEYPLGMKLLILNSVVSNSYSYDVSKGKASSRKRDNTTIAPHFNPNSLFMNKIIDKAFSSNSTMDDYFYEAINFKEAKIDLSDYKKNIHSVTKNGTWYKFTKDNVGDLNLFYKMSALSSEYPGAWCTGGSLSTASSYMDKGDMYVFYSIELNNPTIQLYIHKNGEALEVGGLDSGQAIRTQDFNDLDEFEKSNSFNLKDVQEYTKYSKVLEKWNKGNRDNSLLTSDEMKTLYYAKKYIKDRSSNLDDFKKSLSKKDYSIIFDVKEEDVLFKGELSLTNKDNFNKLYVGDISFYETDNITLPLIITGKVSLYAKTIPENFLQGTTIGGDLNLRSLETASENFLQGTTIGGDLNLHSLETASENFLKETMIGWDVYLNSLTKASENLLQGATIGGNLDLSSLTEASENFLQGATIGGNLSLRSLETASENFLQGTTIGGDLNLRSLETASENFLQGTTIGGDLNLRSLETASENFLKETTIGWNLSLRSLETASENFLKETTIGGGVYLSGGRVYNHNQILNQDRRGVIVKNDTVSLTVFNKNSDLTTIIHEKAHEYEDVLSESEVDVLEKWSGYKKGTTEFSEAFAKGAEKVLYDGVFGENQVDSIFNKFKQWFKEIISDAISYFSDLNEMNQDVLNIYSRMMTNDLANDDQSIRNETVFKDVELSVMEQSLLEESDFDKKGKVKSEVIESIRKERQEIEAKAIADSTFGLAPNGNKSNLDNEQWVTVRTKRFKDWFGDWENNPENSSKVVDDNGEPLVVYHGSHESFSDFSYKNMGNNGTSLGQGHYFTNVKNTARYYSENKNIYEVFLNIRKELSRDKLTITKENLKKIITEIDELSSENGEHYFLNNYEEVDYYGFKKVLNDAVNLEYSSSDNDVDLIGSLINSSGNIEGVFEVLNKNNSLYGSINNITKNETHYVIGVPTQIKSAVSNVGTFSNDKVNIYNQMLMDDSFDNDIQVEKDRYDDSVNKYHKSETNKVVDLILDNSDNTKLDLRIQDYENAVNNGIVVEKLFNDNEIKDEFNECL